MLEVRGLTTQFATRRGTVHAVNGVSFDIGDGEITGIVGESGSGKSVTVRSVLGLVRQPGRVTGGSVRLA
jgi:peptide/nickel transport system ATP-binding protein